MNPDAKRIDEIRKRYVGAMDRPLAHIVLDETEGKPRKAWFTRQADAERFASYYGDIAYLLERIEELERERLSQEVPTTSPILTPSDMAWAKEQAQKIVDEDKT